MPAPPRPRLHWTNLIALTVAYVTVALLWNTPIVYPLRLLVVFLHEISHGLAAALTGGRVLELVVVAEEGGHCITEGGNRIAILSAGYLGSLAFGASILLVATRTKLQQIVAAVLGFVLVYAAAMYVPWAGNTFGKLFGMAAGGVLAYLALLPPVWSQSALMVVGLTSCLYSVVDIYSDILDREHELSDASALAAITPLPATVWGLIWITISLGVTVLAIKWSIVHHGELEDAPAKPAKGNKATKTT